MLSAMHPWARRLSLAMVMVTACAGCTHDLRIDRSHPSSNQDSRVQFIVIHATEIDFTTSLRVLTKGDVSSHYLIDRDGRVYALVPEERRAWHAGPSYWEGATPLNPSSIGIEIVSVPPGQPEGTDVPFPPAQMDSVRRLVADIARRHQVRPDRIVGHGEIQPEGRTDPGRRFPWSLLVADGLVPFPSPDAAATFRRQFETDPPSILWLQERLSMHGYRIACTGLLDTQTQEVLRVFQGRYRPADTSGNADPETLSILAALTSPDGRLVHVSRDSAQVYRTEKPSPVRCSARQG